MEKKFKKVIINTKRVQSFTDKDTEVLVVIFEGELVYLTMEEVEYNIERYFKIRENLREEKRLRKKHQGLQELWEQYQTMLALCKDYKNGNSVDGQET